jgi:hypothetical protein
MSPSGHGFLVMDASLKLIDANGEAERVLVYVYPEDPQKIKSADSFLTQKIRSALLKGSVLSQGRLRRRAQVGEEALPGPAISSLITSTL